MLVVSDILRAALVLLIPLAVIVNVLLVYPLVFLVTAISIFFRPARVAILPQIVEEDELRDRELGDVGRRDDRGRHRLRHRRPVRGGARDRRCRSRSGSMP